MDMNRNGKWDADEPHRKLFVTIGELDKLKISDRNNAGNSVTDTTNSNATPAPPSDLLVIWEDPATGQADLDILASWVPNGVDGKYIRWEISPTNDWSNFVGDFSGGVLANSTWTRANPSTRLYEVILWSEKNSNLICDPTEQKRKLRILIVPALSQWNNIQAARISNPTVSNASESYYAINQSEHFEIGGTFGFRIIPFAGSPDFSVGNATYELWDADYGDDLLTTGAGAQFSYALGTSSNDAGWAYVKFRCGSQEVQSPDFWIMTKYRHSLTFSQSSAITTTLPVAQACLDADMLLIKKDSYEDRRAVVEISESGAMTTIPAGGHDPLDMELRGVPGDFSVHDTWGHKAYFLDHPNARNVIIVNDIRGCDAAGNLIRDVLGFAEFYKYRIFLQEPSFTAATFAHELGHNCDLPDLATLGEENRVMWYRSGGNANLLTQEEAKKYDAGE
jgi:hypothetical protein